MLGAMSPRISVIIPVHNESAILARCVNSLAADARSGEVEVLFVCNGCTDDSERVLKELAPWARVLVSPDRGKPQALNYADAHARGAERHYIDADVSISPGAITEVSAQMATRGLLAASPRIDIDVRGASWSVRNYMSTWQQSPYFTKGLLGAGYYAISAKGRARFGTFPLIKADDHFVYSLFQAHERGIVESARFSPLWPQNFADLWRVEVRHFSARVEFEEALRRGQLSANAEHVKPQRAWLLDQLRTPNKWASVAEYVAVKALTGVAGRLNHRFGDRKAWARDESSRK